MTLCIWPVDWVVPIKRKEGKLIVTYTLRAEQWGCLPLWPDQLLNASTGPAKAGSTCREVLYSLRACTGICMQSHSLHFFTTYAGLCGAWAFLKLAHSITSITCYCIWQVTCMISQWDHAKQSNCARDNFSFFSREKRICLRWDLNQRRSVC